MQLCIVIGSNRLIAYQLFMIKHINTFLAAVYQHFDVNRLPVPVSVAYPVLTYTFDCNKNHHFESMKEKNDSCALLLQYFCFSSFMHGKRNWEGGKCFKRSEISRDAPLNFSSSLINTRSKVVFIKPIGNAWIAAALIISLNKSTA